jgi:NFU1 iron-sulfur cluster scaffold homolog, mitochondrial
MLNKTNNKKFVSIYMEANPNPNSMKFVANFMLVPEGTSFDYSDIDSTSNSPIAQALFDKEYVARVFVMSNFITVTKKDNTEWFEIQNEIRDFIKVWLEDENPVVIKDEVLDVPANAENATEVEIKIKMILDEYIRPAVEQDGGAIQLHSFQDGVVKVLLQGSCSGCPSSTITLKAGIENLLKRMVPEVQSVEAQGV